jgi:hypothetical protein
LRWEEVFIGVAGQQDCSHDLRGVNFEAAVCQFDAWRRWLRSIALQGDENVSLAAVRTVLRRFANAVLLHRLI